MDINLYIIESYRESMGEEWESFVLDIIDEYIESIPGMFSSLRVARMAEDDDTFERVAHTIKSNSKTFGAKALADLAAKLESGARDGVLNGSDQLLNKMEWEFQTVRTELLRYRESLLPVCASLAE